MVNLREGVMFYRSRIQTTSPLGSGHPQTVTIANTPKLACEIARLCVLELVN